MSGSVQQFRPPMIAAANLTGKRFVKQTSTARNVTPCTVAGEQAFGVVDSDFSAGNHCSVTTLGEAVVTSSEAIDVGQTVSASANGRARVLVAGDIPLAVALTAAAGANADLRVFVLPQLVTSNAGLSASFADGLGVPRVAMATYDFAEHGGAQGAIGLGVTIPDNAIVWDGFYDCITTATSAGDSATFAIHVQSANDLKTATAISSGTTWDAGGPKAIVPVGTAAAAIKLTAAREITVTIGVEDVTAGKFTVYVVYFPGL